MATSISNSEDVIDSRDVIARIDELEDERMTLTEALENAREVSEDALTKADEAAAGISEDFDTLSAASDSAQEEVDNAHKALEEWDDDNGEELTALLALAGEAEGYASDWKDGSTLVRDSYFVEYAQQLADDIGAINKDARWPNDCIDWDKAAEELQQDYTAVEFDGVTYWVQ